MHSIAWAPRQETAIAIRSNLCPPSHPSTRELAPLRLRRALLRPSEGASSASALALVGTTGSGRADAANYRALAVIAALYHPWRGRRPGSAVARGARRVCGRHSCGAPGERRSTAAACAYTRHRQSHEDDHGLRSRPRTTAGSRPQTRPLVARSSYGVARWRQLGRCRNRTAGATPTQTPTGP